MPVRVDESAWVRVINHLIHCDESRFYCSDPEAVMGMEEKGDTGVAGEGRLER